MNVFPSVKYHLAINIRRDEASALQQYFKLEVRFLWVVVYPPRPPKRELAAGPIELERTLVCTPDFPSKTNQAEADEPRSKGRRLLPSRRSSPKAANNISSTSGGGERVDAPPDSPSAARDASGDGADLGVPCLLEHQGSEEGRALLLGRRAAGSAPSNQSGGVAAAAAVAGLEAGKKVVLQRRQLLLFPADYFLPLWHLPKLPSLPFGCAAGVSSRCPLPARSSTLFSGLAALFTPPGGREGREAKVLCVFRFLPRY